MPRRIRPEESSCARVFQIAQVPPQAWHLLGVALHGDGWQDFLITAASSAVVGPKSGRIFVVTAPRFDDRLGT